MPPCPASLLRVVAFAAALLVAATPSQAQYKVVGADGKVTYSDRQPPPAEGQVTSLGARAPSASAELDLPFELRQVVAKYPVTLYTTTDGCEPCALARQLLKQRGVPFSERLIVSAEDSQALERVAGSNQAPTLTIGAQALRGFTSETWNSYLDAAGYPRQSRLPATYQAKPATPMVERRDPTIARTGDAAAPAPSSPPAPAPTPAAPGGIRF